MAVNSKIDLSVTLFSLAYPFYKGDLDLDGCLGTVSEMGYQGVEIVAPQMIPNYPAPDDRFCGWLRDKMTEYGLNGYAYGSYIDMTRFTGRNLTEDEMFSITLQDIMTAAKLGFRSVKSNVSMTPRVLERLAPIAEGLGVWIGLELHAPNHCRDEVWAPMFRSFERVGADVAGVVPDTGIFAAHPHKLFQGEALETGVSQGRLDLMLAAHREKLSPAQAERELGQMSEAERTVLQRMYAEFSPAPLNDLDYMLPYSRYMHGKYFYLDENDRDDCVPFPAIVRKMKENGFCGAISAEYEGYFHDVSIDSVEQVRRFSRMMQPLIRD